MMPGGHLATSIVLAGGSHAAGASPEFSAGCLLGGFFIDFDHYLDYLVFDGQWRKPGPRAFLRHYFELRVRRVVLPLHSLELMAVLTFLGLSRDLPLVSGYVSGAAMHLMFDILVNGEHVLRSPVLFYSFAYRARHGFMAEALLDPVSASPGQPAADPFLEFFRWRPKWSKERPGPGDSTAERSVAAVPARKSPDAP